MCDETRYIEVDATWDITVYVWPDGSWCYDDELESTLQYHSDDFATLRLAEDPLGLTIDELVELELSRPYITIDQEASA